MSAAETLSWLPPGLTGIELQALEVRTRVPVDDEAIWHCLRPAPDQWQTVADQLRRAGEVLQSLPVERIVTAIDRVAARWCDRDWPVRAAARERVVRATGFSPAAVDHSFDLELRNYRADSLWRTLRRELTDPACLDALVPDRHLEGATLAIGPRLVLAVFTGNVPALPALSLVRSLLVKAPVIAKVASGEPSFAAAFAASLHAELPPLGEALLVTYWDREETDLVRTIARQADQVIAYGGETALAALRPLLPPGIRRVEHGHKLSVGLLGGHYLARRGLEDCARALARDVVAFNQQACIAPQAYFIQADREQTRQLAEILGRTLAETASHCPVGRLRREDAARLQLARSRQHWETAEGQGADLWHGADLEWTVTLDDRLEEATGLGNRFLRLIPVTGLDAMLDQLRPFAGYLQNIGLGLEGDALHRATVALARLGASRICEPGRMAEPSLMWRHDGHLGLADLIRWCDVEMHRGL